MTHTNFLSKLKLIQKEYDDYYEEHTEDQIRITFSLNEVYFFYDTLPDFRNISKIMIFYRNIPQKLLFKNVDIIKENHNNSWRNSYYKYYEIDINDFFNKLKF